MRWTARGHRLSPLPAGTRLSASFDSDEVLVREILQAAKGQATIMTDEEVFAVIKRVRS